MKIYGTSAVFHCGRPTFLLGCALQGTKPDIALNGKNFYNQSYA
ncbi:MAG: hypothetical protein ACTTI6_02030 [Treponema sp.]